RLQQTSAETRKGFLMAVDINVVPENPQAPQGVTPSLQSPDDAGALRTASAPPAASVSPSPSPNDAAALTAAQPRTVMPQAPTPLDNHASLFKKILSSFPGGTQPVRDA